MGGEGQCRGSPVWQVAQAAANKSILAAGGEICYKPTVATAERTSLLQRGPAWAVGGEQAGRRFPPDFAAMHNFLRVVRTTLRRRFTFAAAVLCSLGVAFLWGANLGLIKPIIEIVFADKPPHALVDSKVQVYRDNQAAAQTALAAVDADLAKAAAADKPPLDRRRRTLVHQLDTANYQLRIAKWVEPKAKAVLPNTSFGALALFVSLLIGATLIKDSMLVANLMLVERMTQLAMFDVRKKMFRKTLTMEVARFGEDHTSHIVHRITSDINFAMSGVNVLTGKMILEPLKMLACLIGAAIISWRLLVVSLLVAPLAVYIMVRLSRSMKRANRRAMEEAGKLYTTIAESVSGIQSVKAFGMERHERRRFHASGKKCYRRSMRITLFNALTRATAEFMGTGIISVAILVGAYLVIQQQTSILGIHIMDKPLSLGSLMAFYALLAGVSDPARKLSEVMHTLQRGMAAADRIYDVLDRDATIVDPPEPKFPASPRPDLVFENVSFHYKSGKPVLQNINLRIPFGETVAIVGPNGCGKTTLANLLLRFYDPVDGAVRLDGVDLREMRMRDVRGMTGLVAQQAMLFDDTVANNIRYGSPHASDDEVIAAAEKAYAHRFILDKLSDGYESEVGERGGKISGGQRQRILLARAILRDPKFLIMDEATSQIDLESEQLIHKVLEQFIHGRTTLMITHRMSSIALCDRIVVMDGGLIIDSGAHDELVRRCDLYRRLYDLGFRQSA